MGPNVNSLKSGFDELKINLNDFLKKKGIEDNDKKFNEILSITLNEDHMCIFKQII